MVISGLIFDHNDNNERSGLSPWLKMTRKALKRARGRIRE